MAEWHLFNATGFATNATRLLLLRIPANANANVCERFSECLKSQVIAIKNATYAIKNALQSQRSQQTPFHLATCSFAYTFAGFWFKISQRSLKSRFLPIRNRRGHSQKNQSPAKKAL